MRPAVAHTQPAHSLEAADPDGEEGEEGQHPQGQDVAVLAAQHCKGRGQRQRQVRDRM
jgi:hypothetical protein